MGKTLDSGTHPDQSLFPLDIDPCIRYASYTAEELDKMIAELWERYERGDDMSDSFYRPIEEYY